MVSHYEEFHRQKRRIKMLDLSPEILIGLIVSAFLVHAVAKKVSINLQKERFQQAIKQAFATCLIITVVIFSANVWLQIARSVRQPGNSQPPAATATPTPTPSPPPGHTASRGQRQKGNSGLRNLAIRVPPLSLTPKPTPQEIAQSTASPTPQAAFEQPVQPTQTPTQQPTQLQTTPPQPMSPTAPQTAPAPPCTDKPPIQFPAGRSSN